MPLSWIVHEIDGERRVFIQGGGRSDLCAAQRVNRRLKGEFVEAHHLDDVRARKVPKAMRGRVLTKQEARALLDRLA